MGPQRQLPSVHESAVEALQAAQAPPLAPHCWKREPTQALPSQQPLQPEEVSQAQLPAPVVTQRWPTAQAALFLHLQTPLLQLLPRSPQSTQAAPPMPQVASAEGTQVPPLQQPLGQVVASQGGPHAPPSQRQLPPTHVAGAAQGAPLPQAHCPESAQLSATVGLQAVQATPLVPHAAALDGWQKPPEQQPRGHESPLHTHAPPWQICPKAQGGLVPQRQSPLVHRSASCWSHTLHALPSRPQVCRPGALQVAPLQQPASQPAAQSGQTPASQPAVGVHAVQAPPAVPHCESVRPGRQLLPEQQPEGQVLGSQRQAPPTQVCPGRHSAPVPQRQTPLSQRSAATVSQALQVPPPEPQRFRLPTTQTPLAQQPLGQLAASQTSPGPTFTTTVVSAPVRVIASAVPEPTTAPAASASMRTVIVPV